MCGGKPGEGLVTGVSGTSRSDVVWLWALGLTSGRTLIDRNGLSMVVA